MDKIDKTKLIMPSQYNNELNSLRERVDLVLNEFKKSLVLSKVYAGNDEYIQQFNNSEEKLKQFISSLFKVSVNIQNSVDDINKQLLEIDENIKREKEINRELSRKLEKSENKSTASKEMINDYKHIYNEVYLRNWAIGINILIGIIAISFITKKNV